MTLLLNNTDVVSLLDMPSCIDALERGYRSLGLGEAINRPKTYLVVLYERDASYSYCTMEGADRELGVVAIRMKSDMNRHVERYGALRHEKWASREGMFCGLVLLFSARTAELLAIFNDGLMQQVRVAGTNAVAAKYLARMDATVLGMIGSGNQARSHAKAFAAVRMLQKIKVYSPNPEHRNAYASEMSGTLGIEVEPVDSAREAMDGADFVSPNTNAQGPVAKAEWLSPGAHVGGAGGGLENIHERADVIVKHHILDTAHYVVGTAEEAETAPKASGRGRRESLGEVPTLPQLALGQVPGRTRPEQITYFANNEGNGLQFAACGALVYQRALERGIGRELPTDWFLQDTRD